MQKSVLENFTMSSGVCRLGSLSSGHDKFPPRPVISGSDNVFINGLPATNVGSTWAIHCDDNSCHSCNQATGSSTVFVNSRQLVRVGDATGCNDYVASGSDNVFCG